jgi:hypothetical protein
MTDTTPAYLRMVAEWTTFEGEPREVVLACADEIERVAKTYPIIFRGSEDEPQLIRVPMADGEVVCLWLTRAWNHPEATCPRPVRLTGLQLERL